MILKIGTLNLRNNKTNRNGGLRSDGINNAEIIAKLINSNNYDILGTQELTRNYKKEIKKYLDDYKFYGGYRFGSNIISRNIKVINDYNENNNIITKYKIISKKTIFLPFIPFKIKELFIGLKNNLIFPRIITVLLININDNIICSINTHLDYKLESIQKRQLKKLYKVILKYSKKYKVVLTGDFNLEIGLKNFDKFVDDIKLLNLKRVEINKKTNSKKFKNTNAIDHIFIPDDWKIINQGIIKTGKASDHDNPFVEVEV